MCAVDRVKRFYAWIRKFVQVQWYSVRLHSLALTAMGVSASVMKAKEDEAAKAAEELTAAKQVSHDVDACPPSFPKQRFCLLKFY